ncbi:MAG: NAD-dependent epimerase/dehydratase family protein, partial [Burkholderiales bacterium]
MDMVLVTGATGFVGRAFVDLLVSQGKHSVRVALRREGPPWPDAVERANVKDLAPDNDWAKALDGVRVVVHAAARVHVMQDKSSSPLAEFRRVNVQGTLNLARQAAAAGVRRFV